MGLWRIISLKTAKLIKSLNWLVLIILIIVLKLKIKNRHLRNLKARKKQKKSITLINSPIIPWQ